MMNGGGVAMIGHGEATGGDRIRVATEEALSSPLLEIDVSDAKGALINVVGGSDPNPRRGRRVCEDNRQEDRSSRQNHLGRNYRGIRTGWLCEGACGPDWGA